MRVLEALLVSVHESEARASGADKGYGCGLADSWGELVWGLMAGSTPVEEIGLYSLPDAEPVISPTPGSSAMS